MLPVKVVAPLVVGLVVALLCVFNQDFHDPTLVAQDRALDRILALPEVRELSRRVPVVAILDEIEPSGLLNVCVAENHATHTVRWATFQADPATGRLKAWDEQGGWADLYAWRILPAPDFR